MKIRHLTNEWNALHIKLSSIRQQRQVSEPPFLPDAVFSTLQTEWLQKVIKITVENDGNIRDICRKWYGIWGEKSDKENNERMKEVQEKARTSDEETEGL